VCLYQDKLEEDIMESDDSDGDWEFEGGGEHGAGPEARAAQVAIEVCRQSCYPSINHNTTDL
jgi:hypothetical protein